MKKENSLVVGRTYVLLIEHFKNFFTEGVLLSELSHISTALTHLSSGEKYAKCLIAK
jgi:hypothetical protein